MALFPRFDPSLTFEQRFPRLASFADAAPERQRAFAERFPQLAGRLTDNRNTLQNVGLALLTARSRNDVGPAVQNAFAYGRQLDDRDRERRQQEEERQQQTDAAIQLLGQLPDLPVDAQLAISALGPQGASQYALGRLLPQDAAGIEPTDDMREYQYYVQQAQAAGETPMPFAQWMGQGGTEANREMREDQNGVLRWVDTGEPVFPDVQATPAGAEAPPTEIFTGPDGKPHRMGWNPQTGAYDIDYGIAASTGGQTINVGGSTQVGTIPQGYRLIYDDDGRPTAMEPIPGGPEDTTAQDAARQQGQMQQANNLLRAVDQALDLADQPMTTGWDGAIAARVPGTPAYDLRRQVETIKAIIGFQELQAMRQSSPTGAAVGNLTERELSYLQAVWANLDPNQSHDMFVENLSYARDITQGIIDGLLTVDDEGNVVQRAATDAAPAPAAAASAGASPNPAPGGGTPVGATATNPQTGERIRWNGTEWEPMP